MTTTARIIADEMAAVIGGGVTVAESDDFFEVGGHSLGAMKLLGRLRRKGVSLEIADILTGRTPAAIAAAVDGGSDSIYDDESFKELVTDDVVLKLSNGEGLPVWGFHSIVGLAWSYAPLARRLGNRWPVIGIQVPSAEQVPEIGFDHDDLCRFYLSRMKEIQPEGPYRLMGYSSGGAIAHTIAGMLQADGETVDVLAMIDAYPSGVQPECPGGIAAAMAMFLGTDEQAGKALAEGEQEVAAELPAAEPEDTPGERGDDFWDSFEEEDDGGFGLIPELNDNHIRGMIAAAGAPDFDKDEVATMIDAAGRTLMYYLSSRPWDYDGDVLLMLANDEGRVEGINWDPQGAWDSVVGAERVEAHDVDFQHLALVSDEAWAVMAPVIAEKLIAADTARES